MRQTVHSLKSHSFDPMFVDYMSSSFWLLAVGSRDLSQAEKRFVFTSLATHKMATIFVQNDQLFPHKTILRDFFNDDSDYLAFKETTCSYSKFV